MAKKKEMEVKTVVYRGYTFILGKSSKFDRDFERVKELIDSNVIDDHYVHLELLRIYNASYHDNGKIEGITSFDSSCGNCEFCQKMMCKAKENPLMICGYCYDDAQEQFKIFVRNRHGLNLLIWSTVLFTVEELKILPATELDRINSSGETPNVTYAKNSVNLAYAHPDRHFGYFSKNTAPIVAAIDELGKPKNLVLVQSSIRIGIPDRKAKYFDYVFTVYPDKASCAEAIRNGASPCNGMKCRDCGFKCYYGTHESDQIAEVLRGVNKDIRKEIVQAYYDYLAA